MVSKKVWSEGGLSKSLIALRHMNISLYNFRKCYTNKLSIDFMNPRYADNFPLKLTKSQTQIFLQKLFMKLI